MLILCESPTLHFAPQQCAATNDNQCRVICSGTPRVLSTQSCGTVPSNAAGASARLMSMLANTATGGAP
eukprot:scaffold242520_cov36-Tisochrysis_lutea.AAC.3